MLKEYKKDLEKSQKAKNIDDPLDTYVIEPLGMIFAKLFIKMKFIPNAVTLTSMFVGVAGAVCLLFKVLWINIVGIALIILASIFDCSDGQVARLTNRKSMFGRMLDGFVDMVIYFCIYSAVCFRLMTENIPFTDTKWSFWIWVIALPIAILCHSKQAKVADYYRNVYLCCSKAKNGTDLTRSKDLLKAVEQSTGFLKFSNKCYYTYTKEQEKLTPTFQKFLDKVQDFGSCPDEIREHFHNKTKHLVKVCNLLTYNLRSYVLFTFILLSSISALNGIEVFHLAFLLFVLEPIKMYILHSYKKVSIQCLKMYEKLEQTSQVINLETTQIKEANEIA